MYDEEITNEEYRQAFCKAEKKRAAERDRAMIFAPNLPTWKPSAAVPDIPDLKVVDVVDGEVFLTGGTALTDQAEFTWASPMNDVAEEMLALRKEMEDLKEQMARRVALPSHLLTSQSAFASMEEMSNMAPPSMEETERAIDEEYQRMQRNMNEEQKNFEAAAEWLASQDQETLVEMTPKEPDNFDRAMKGL